MPFQPPLANDKKRVKVYELRNGDWFDLGTGLCTGQVVNDEHKILVESEDQPEQMLLDTTITPKDDHQKQQDTLIVWTNTNGIDMALSFQEAEGCALIWKFVSQVQQHQQAQQHQQMMSLADESLSDDALDSLATAPFSLNPPELSNLDEIEHAIRAASMSQPGRDSMVKFLIREGYLLKLIPLVSVAEDLESLADLHRLCNIMKALILINDNSIIEHLVDDDIILGVVGALEYDPDFPTHKANHRQYLADESRFKEVVEIKHRTIRKKIRQTWRLQYLKDVVLARILDDPTFGVLNSIIFFNQVEIVQHLQNNTAFLKELFAIFTSPDQDTKRKEQAVLFLQQCTAIAKTLQIQSRANLLNNLIQHGLFNVIAFAIKHPSASMRTTGIDILVALLDHDPNMMRAYMLKAVHEKRVPLTDTLIELLHTDTDLGVKNQLSDALKVLLDPQPPNTGNANANANNANANANNANANNANANNANANNANAHNANNANNSSSSNNNNSNSNSNTNANANNASSSDFVTKLQRQPQLTPTQAANEQFAQDVFDRSCGKLFAPLNSFDDPVHELSHQQVSLFAYLVDILTYFVRQHSPRSRHFVTSDNLPMRVAQLLRVPQKPLKLTAVKFFRTAVSLQDPFYSQHIIDSKSFELIIDIVIDTMPRDNLLNSACLEMFEFIRRESIKPLILHLGQTYRQKLQNISYVDTFSNLLLRFDQLTAHKPEVEHMLLSQDDDDHSTLSMSRASMTGRWQGLVEMDPEEEGYFNASDEDDEDEGEDEDEDAENDNDEDSDEAGHPSTSTYIDTPMQRRPTATAATRGQAKARIRQAHPHPHEFFNGTTSSVPSKLVDYPDDDDDDDDDDDENDDNNSNSNSSSNNNNNSSSSSTHMIDSKQFTPKTPLTPESEKENSPQHPQPSSLSPSSSPSSSSVSPPPSSVSPPSSSSALQAHKTLRPSPDIRAKGGAGAKAKGVASSANASAGPSSANEPNHILQQQPPPERLAEKRRRQESEEDDDELSKLSSGPKRRNSGGSQGMISNHSNNSAGTSPSSRPSLILHHQNHQNHQNHTGVGGGAVGGAGAGAGAGVGGGLLKRKKGVLLKSKQVAPIGNSTTATAAGAGASASASAGAGAGTDIPPD